MTTTIRARFTRKPCSLDEVLHNSDPSASPETITIEFRKELTTAEYDTFANTLLDDRDWLTGRGGHANGLRQVVEVSAPGRTTLYVDPSGGSYGRYVGVAIESPTPSHDQASAIRWLLDNRRPEVSIDQALRAMRIALGGDRTAMKLLDQIAAEK
ncbi:MAG: hypothetical protein ACK52I_27580 [Pseudomonadota bacterium]